MNTPASHYASGGETETSREFCKLDLGYFTERGKCPLMVHRGARGAFELFLYLAHRFLQAGGIPVVVEREEACRACGIDPENRHSGAAVSRLLRSLRESVGVIDYEPRRRRAPQIALTPARPGSDPLHPRHYVYFYEGWNAVRRSIFDTLGPRAFAAEYMYFIAEYESALARIKHHRSYWFYPLEKISATYHVSAPFASAGLRALVHLGAMRISFGQHGLRAANDEFGASNRYYFEGLGGSVRRRGQLELVQHQYEAEFEAAIELSNQLTNGATIKNVGGLCALIAEHGKRRVRAAVEQLATLPLRSLKRRVGYVKAIVERPKTDRPNRKR